MASSAPTNDRKVAQELQPDASGPFFLRPPFHYFFAIVSGSVAVAAAFFGLDGALHPADLSRFVFSLVWLAVGLNAACSVYAILLKRRWWITPSLASALSGLFLGGFVLWIDERSPEPERWAFAFWLLLAVSVLATALIASAIRLTPLNAWAVLAAAILPWAGVFQFWYSTQYAPIRERPQINLSSSLEELGGSGDTMALRATISAENKGKARVQVLGSIYRVTATFVDPTKAVEDSDTGRIASAFEWFGNERQFTKSALEKAPPETLQADEVLPIISFFEPGQTWTTNFVVYVNVKQYNTVRLTAEISVAQSTQLELEDPVNCFHQASSFEELIERLKEPDQTEQGDQFVCVERQIRPRNAVEKHAGDKPRIRTYLILAEKKPLNTAYPQLRVYYGTPKTFTPTVSSEQLYIVALELERKYPGVITWSRSEQSLEAKTSESKTPTSKTPKDFLGSQS